MKVLRELQRQKTRIAILCCDTGARWLALTNTGENQERSFLVGIIYMKRFHVKKFIKARTLVQGGLHSICHIVFDIDGNIFGPYQDLIDWRTIVKYRSNPIFNPLKHE